MSRTDYRASDAAIPSKAHTQSVEAISLILLNGQPALAPAVGVVPPELGAAERADRLMRDIGAVLREARLGLAPSSTRRRSSPTGATRRR